MASTRPALAAHTSRRASPFRAAERLHAIRTLTWMPLRPVPARAAARPFIALALATCAAALAACGDAPTGSAAGTDQATLSIVLAASAGSASAPLLADGHLALAPGDSARLGATLRDARGATRTPTGLAWTVVDRAVADVDAAGLLRAKGAGATNVIASAGQVADTVHLVVSTCGTATPVSLEVGQVRALAAGQGSDLCVVGGTTGGGSAEYALIPVAASQATLPASLDVTATGLVPLAADARAPLGAPSLARAALPGGADEPVANETFHLELQRSAERLLAGRIAPARAAYRARRAAGAGGSIPGVSLARLAATAKVGDVVSLNTGSVACKADPADRRAARVAAVTQHAIVLADTLNPANGFTDTEYRNFGVAFDTLVYPVDVANFGEPTDLDGNGKVLILFTSAVNALTPRGASYYVGGFFYSRDLFPPDKPSSQGGCAGSNDAEMFYMLVPDPTGQVNGNRRSKTFVANMTISTLGHEFQHLINSSRRVYVNDADKFEETWLDEGLAHVAEELVFYQAAGLSPRGGLTAGAIRSSSRVRSAFNEHATGNIGRLRAYLEAPETNSPFAPNDELETRGATWSLLRYSADRLDGATERDADFWQRLVNAKAVGRANLQAALGLTAAGGATLDDWARDWAVATYADRQAAGLDARYTQPSWDFHDIFAALGNGDAYPLMTRTLADGHAQHLTLSAGAAGYLRFAVAAGREASLKVRDAASPMPASVRLAVVRTR